MPIQFRPWIYISDLKSAMAGITMIMMPAMMTITAVRAVMLMTAVRIMVIDDD